jgi:lysozyme
MKLNAAGIALIKEREACRLEAYLCPGGVWTIGYGHSGSEIHEGLAITPADAEALLHADLLRIDACVARLCPSATESQHAAMVCLAYNIGCGAFSRSSVARLHNAGRTAEAAQAFALWNKARGRVLPGLVARRAAEVALYLADDGTAAGFADGEKPLSESRTLAGSSLGGAAVGATALGELASQVDAWRSQTLALLPYFESLRWALLVLILAGLSLAAYARWHDRREGRS